MIDVELPTTDGRTIVLSRHTQPEDDPCLLLLRLKLDLPPQPPPSEAAEAVYALIFVVPAEAATLLALIALVDGECAAILIIAIRSS